MFVIGGAALFGLASRRKAEAEREAERACKDALAQGNAQLDRDELVMARQSVVVARAGCPSARQVEVEALDKKVNDADFRSFHGSPKPRKTAGAKPAGAKKKRDNCSANDQWSIDMETMELAPFNDNPAGFVKHFRDAGAECRRKAFDEECAHGCIEVLSDMLLDATTSKTERATLLRVRYDGNVAGVRKGRQLYAEVLGEARRAAALPVPNPDDMACFKRFGDDKRRIAALQAKLKEAAPLPGGLYLQLQGPLSHALGCVNCSPSSHGECAEMLPELKDGDETIREYEKLVAADRAKLAQLGVTP